MYRIQLRKIFQKSLPNIVGQAILLPRKNQIEKQLFINIPVQKYNDF